MSKPGDGERRSAGGLFAQYRYAAWVILRELSVDRLDWIKVADPEAGQVDDLLVGTSNRVDGFQVKWSTFPGTITPSDLLHPREGKDPLLKQLANGWKTLQTSYPTSRIVVHLVTNDSPSTTKSNILPTGSIEPSPNHLASFFEQAWKPFFHW